MNIKKTAFIFALAATVALPSIASAQNFVLDTGTPTNFSAPVELLNASFAAEFSVSSTTSLASLSAYLTEPVGDTYQGTPFEFALYTSLPTRTHSTQPIDTTTATYESNGWNGTSVNWSLAAGTYYLAILSAGSSNILDLPTEASANTGTAPAEGFEYAGSNGQYAASSTYIGLQVAAVPEPSSWALGLVAVTLLCVLRRRAGQAA